MSRLTSTPILTEHLNSLMISKALSKILLLVKTECASLQIGQLFTTVVKNTIPNEMPREIGIASKHINEGRFVPGC